MAEEQNCIKDCQSEPATVSIQITDVDDNDPVITAIKTNITIKENGNLYNLTGVSVNDLDSDYQNSKYKLILM